MTATVTAPETREVARRVPIIRGYRFELVKLLTQWRVRVLMIACWLAPGVFVAVISQQASLTGRHIVRSLDARHRMGWSACPAWVLRFLGVAVADLVDRR